MNEQNELPISTTSPQPQEAAPAAVPVTAQRVKPRNATQYAVYAEHTEASDAAGVADAVVRATEAVAVELPVEAGDFVGHEFHGNQYGSGSGGGAHNEASKKANVASNAAKDSKSAADHTKAAKAHAAAAKKQTSAGNEDTADYHTAMANFHNKAAAKIASKKMPAKATDTTATAVVTAAHGEVTGKPSFATLQQRVTQAVQGDTRFDDGRRGFQAANGTGSGDCYCFAPYCNDILAPDDDGSLTAVICTSGYQYFTIGFTWDGETLTLDDGDAMPTAQATVYAAEAKVHDEAVRAGDYVGHPFHGNQHSSGSAAGAHNKASKSANDASHEAATSKTAKAHTHAAAAHKKAAKAQMAAGNEDAADYHNAVADFHAKAATKIAAKKPAKASDTTEDDAVTAAGSSTGAASGVATKKGGAASRATAAAATATAAAATATGDDKAQAESDASDAHTNASAAHKAAYAAAMKADKDGAADKHMAAMKAHDAMAAMHDCGEDDDGGEVAATAAAAETEAAVQAAVQARATAAYIPVTCTDSGIVMDTPPALWELDKPARIPWMPGGDTTIQASWGGRPIRMTVHCDEDTAKTVQASFTNLKGGAPLQKPFGCVEHNEKEAFFWPTGFEWDGDKETVFCTGTPSQLGVTNVNGRIHRSFSPSFTTNAEYAKAKCSECKRGAIGVNKCDCDGLLTFPTNARGSEENPASVVGVHFSIGSLTNKPAFKNMPPVRAKHGEATPSAPVTAAAAAKVEPVTAATVLAALAVKQPAAVPVTAAAKEQDAASVLAAVAKRIDTGLTPAQKILARLSLTGKPA